MTGDDFDVPDACRSAALADVGLPGYVAAVTVDCDGQEHFVLAHGAALGDPTVRYDADCADVAHEQLGELPVEYWRRITIASRRLHRRPPQ